MNGFNQPTAGGPLALLTRLRYQYKNLLQYGVTIDKDPGEGLDFFSAHLVLRDYGWLRNLVLGDYTVSLGQGLVHWQGMAFGKTAELAQMKKQGAVLRPHTGAGEYYFQRGVGMTFGKKGVETTVFYSARRFSASLDTASGGSLVIRSIRKDGYHRTATEISGRRQLPMQTIGIALQYQDRDWKGGIHLVHYKYGIPIDPEPEPYRLYVFRGTRWANLGLHYSGRIRQVHIFGEFGLDAGRHAAFWQGLLWSPAARVDVSLIYRFLSRGYTAFFADPIRENSQPQNEEGFLMAIQWKPRSDWQVGAWADHFRFPWLKYRADAPTIGQEYQVQVTHKPRRGAEAYLRIQSAHKWINDEDHALKPYSRTGIRLHAGMVLTPAWELRQRMEWVEFYTETNRQKTILVFTDLFFKPLQKPWALNGRILFVEGGGYDSRIYAFENDVLYTSSLSPFFEKAWRFYLNFRWKLSKFVQVWVKISRTQNTEKQTIASGFGEIPGPHRTELRLQVRIFR